MGASLLHHGQDPTKAMQDLYQLQSMLEDDSNDKSEDGIVHMRAEHFVTYDSFKNSFYAVDKQKFHGVEASRQQISVLLKNLRRLIFWELVSDIRKKGKQGGRGVVGNYKHLL